MHCAAVIAEYNPLHSGHAWQVSAIRGLGYDRVAAVMSGNFTQRGEPALFGKSVRVRAALAAGVDLVLELSLPYAISGAERFATGGVLTAAGLRGVEALVFGSECGDLKLLNETAGLLSDKKLYQRTRERMSDGVTFARARACAVEELYGREYSDVLCAPNDILGVEYLRAIKRHALKLAPVPIKRQGAPHDSEGEFGEYASASHLRELFCSGGISALAPFLPERALEIFAEAPHLCEGALELPMLSHLRRLDKNMLSHLPECSEGLHNRLFKAIQEAVTLPELYTLAKSRRYTMARIRRLCLAAFLGVNEEDTKALPPYMHVLGLSPKGSELLNGSLLPVSHSLLRLLERGGSSSKFALLEVQSGDIYSLLLNPRGPAGSEYTVKLAKEH